MDTQTKNRSEAILARYAVRKIGWRNWQYISKKNNLDQDIGRTMFDIGRGIKQETNVKTNTCGEDTYMSVRQQFVDAKLVEPIISTENNKIKKTTKMSKADIIRQQNTANKMAVEISEILKLNGKINFHNNFDSRYAELTIIRLIAHAKGYAIEYMTVTKEIKKKSQSKYTDKKEIDNLELKLSNLTNAIIEVIIGYKKVFDDKSNKIFYPNISETCLQDFQKSITMLSEIISFDLTYIITNKKELLFRTKYDHLLTEKQIAMYDSQKDIFNFVTSEPKCLGLVHTMLGSGKTEMIRPLCGWALTNLKSSVTKLLYCCPNEAVLLEVARMVYSLGVPFGLVIYDVSQKKITYKWSSFCTKGKEQDSAILYIADVYCAYDILSNKKNSSDYILIADELTKDADSINNFQSATKYSIATEYFVEMMKILPDRSLIMSATLPTFEQLPEFYSSSAKNNNLTIRSFSASDAKIGCALIDSNGFYYAPHFGSKTSEELKQLLQTISTNPFVGRFYTYEILLMMIKVHQLHGLVVPDLSIEFKNVSNAKQNNIQRLVRSMLTDLSNQPDNIIELVCLPKHYLDTKIEPVDLTKIFTRDINRFNKGTIIFTTNPVDSAIKIYRNNFDNFLSNSDRNIFEQIRFDSLIAKYNKMMEMYATTIERAINKSDDGTNKRNKIDNKKERDTNGFKSIAQLYDSKPQLDFPSELQIGSLEHAERVDKLFKQSTYNAPTNIATMSIDLLPTDSNVSNDIMMMLMSGIGIYTTSDDRLDDIYLKAVLDLAKAGIIKTIISDSSIAYGTNLSVSDIVIDDSLNGIIDQHSMKTLFQMMGRAGRGGNLSYEARIYTTSTDNRLINNLFRYTRFELDEGDRDEVKNINRAFNDIFHKSNK